MVWIKPKLIMDDTFWRQMRKVKQPIDLPENLTFDQANALHQQSALGRV